MSDNEDIPGGNGIFIGKKSRGVRIFGGISYGNSRSGVHIEEGADVQIVGMTTANNGLDGITIAKEGVAPLSEILDKINENIDDLKLQIHLKDELIAEINTIKAQLSSPKPKNTIVQESLKTVKSILEGVAASGIYDSIKYGISAYITTS
ncbi:hypothetical protein [Aeromonas salmonicida]|uniref:Uncharacterized protein n=1 Tax=Aeromonas salmonicida TaxID=645 RepID=A0AAX3VTI0_AERSA|nr:hypothetical protein [Aeromonas salmonicida]WHF36799.1 hypothetical protein QLQ87_00070 [Aeromonas salmonicida]